MSRPLQRDLEFKHPGSIGSYYPHKNASFLMEKNFKANAQIYFLNKNTNGRKEAKKREELVLYTAVPETRTHSRAFHTDFGIPPP